MRRFFLKTKGTLFNLLIRETPQFLCYERLPSMTYVAYKNAFFREMQFWSHCYTVVSYQDQNTKFQPYTFRVQKMCVFARFATLVPLLNVSCVWRWIEQSVPWITVWHYYACNPSQGSLFDITSLAEWCQTVVLIEGLIFLSHNTLLELPECTELRHYRTIDNDVTWRQCASV